MAVDAGMAEPKPVTRRQPAPCVSHQPRGEELPINHLNQ
jgi:hypothetical protein